METAANLLKSVTCSQDSARRTSQRSTDLPTTENISGDAWNYWTWYRSDEGASIRRFDESRGYYVARTEDGAYIGISRERFSAADPAASVYPDYFSNRTFDRFSLNVYSWGEARDKAETALDMAKRYVDGFKMIRDQFGGGGLYLYSKAKGSGKTFLSTIIGNELTRRGHRVRWEGVVNLLQEIKAGFDRESGGSSAEIIDRCKNAEVLILDDLGVEKQSAWVNETLYSILDARMTHGLATIFTSNCLPRGLAYDERVLDRVDRMAEVIEMPEENVRQRLNARSKLGEYLRGGKE